MHTITTLTFADGEQGVKQPLHGLLQLYASVATIAAVSSNGFITSLASRSISRRTPQHKVKWGGVDV